MNRFFSHYGFLAALLTLIADVAMISLFICIASLPVVTIGPALSAGFGVTFAAISVQPSAEEYC